MACTGRRLVVGKQWVCRMSMVDRIAGRMGLLERTCMVELWVILWIGGWYQKDERGT